MPSVRKLLVMAAFSGAMGLGALQAAPQVSDHAVRAGLGQPAVVPPNVFLIVVDAVRADHTSTYGYARSTTPNLTTLIADQGVRFDTATTTEAWTFPSNASLLTGRLPSRLGVVWSDPVSKLPTSTVMLAEYLGEAGYYTAGFITAYYAGRQFGFDQGYDYYHQQIRSNAKATRAAEINQAAMNWITTTWTPVLSGTRPLFLFMYYYDPHTWYDPPAPYDTLYDPTYTGTFTTAVYADGEQVVNGTLTPTLRDVQHLEALHDGEIAYWDSQLGFMLNFLADRHLLDNTLIIVTSDHGEMFGEHGKWTHRNSVYEEGLRVPLLARYTGVISAGLQVTAPVQSLDVTPSILDWLGLPVPAGLDGQSLKPLTQGNVPSQPRAIFSEIDAITNPAWPAYWLAPRYEARAVRQGEWKYHYTIGLNGADALYDLQPASQYETDNVIQTEPYTAASLRQMLVDQFKLLTIFSYLPLSVR